MFCTNCGKKQPDDSKGRFCGYCGGSLYGDVRRNSSTITVSTGEIKAKTSHAFSLIGGILLKPIDFMKNSMANLSSSLISITAISVLLFMFITIFCSRFLIVGKLGISSAEVQLIDQFIPWGKLIFGEILAIALYFGLMSSLPYLLYSKILGSNVSYVEFYKVVLVTFVVSSFMQIAVFIVFAISPTFGLLLMLFSFIVSLLLLYNGMQIINKGVSVSPYLFTIVFLVTTYIYGIIAIKIIGYNLGSLFGPFIKGF
ncbi:MAG: zinc ribbon domain-containing protein [Clostridium sp.]